MSFHDLYSIPYLFHSSYTESIFDPLANILSTIQYKYQIYFGKGIGEWTPDIPTWTPQTSWPNF